MSHQSFWRRVALGVVCIVISGPAIAQAASPGAVKIRVEGGGQTVVPLTTVRTSTAPVDKSGTPCSGTSIGGALQIATGGKWSGYVDPTYGQQVDVIRGEVHRISASPALDSGSYWALYVNGVPASLGVCTTELKPGDEVLLYAACTTATSGCFSGEPLVAVAPRTVAPGVPFTVAVTESSTTYGGPPDYTATTIKAPAAGATVAGGGLSRQTGSDGRATFTSTARGPLTLVATKGGNVRQALTVCVTDGADGRCGTPDLTAPIAVLTGIRDGAHFRRGHAPRQLTARIAADPAGIKDVRLRLTRRDGRRCSYYSGASEKLNVTKLCGATGPRFFSVGSSANPSYLLPFALPRGRYVLDIEVTDKAGNTSTILTRAADRRAGGNRVVFTVR